LQAGDLGFEARNLGPTIALAHAALGAQAADLRARRFGFGVCLSKSACVRCCVRRRPPRVVCAGLDLARSEALRWATASEARWRARASLTSATSARSSPRNASSSDSSSRSSAATCGPTRAPCSARPAVPAPSLAVHFDEHIARAHLLIEHQIGAQQAAGDRGVHVMGSILDLDAA
jgi:hypothetical protein